MVARYPAVDSRCIHCHALIAPVIGHAKRKVLLDHIGAGPLVLLARQQAHGLEADQLRLIIICVGCPTERLGGLEANAVCVTQFYS